MKIHFSGLCQLMALTLLACLSWSALAIAADSPVNDGSIRPRYAVIPQKPAPLDQLAGTLQEWNGSFTYNNVNYPFVMVGADPSSNQNAEITTWVVPVKIVISTGQSFDPLSGGPTGPLARTVLSPIFDRTTTYTQGGVDVGTTQYEDAFQRANFWSIVQNNPNSHLLLGGPTARIGVLPELTLNVPAQDGSVQNDGGIGCPVCANVDINYFDTQISNYMAQSKVINPTGFPIFLTTNTYLTEGGCCIGGYHSANGNQTYAEFTYVTYAGAFSQDVSALSHEAGEWADDPLTNNGNNTPCGILEVGDPLEDGQPGHPYGTWTYELHGFTYHLQDLVFLRYFGGPANGSVNSWWTFQGYTGFTQICQNGS